MPVAEVVTVRRGTAISAVYGTVRIEPAFVVRIRVQNDGFIQLAEPFSAGRGAIGKNVEKGQLLATIADEEAARELKQARADLQAAVDRAAKDVRVAVVDSMVDVRHPDLAGQVAASAADVMRGVPTRAEGTRVVGVALPVAVVVGAGGAEAGAGEGADRAPGAAAARPGIRDEWSAPT